jgi:hypothetical protein
MSPENPAPPSEIPFPSKAIGTIGGSPAGQPGEMTGDAGASLVLTNLLDLGRLWQRLLESAR